MNRVELTGVVVNRDAADPWRVGDSWGSRCQIANREVGYDHEKREPAIVATFLTVTFFIEKAEFGPEDVPRRGDELYVLGSLVQYEGSDGKKHTGVRADVLTIVRRGRQHTPARQQGEEPPF